MAWRSWYHCVATAYAQWLRGDPRGWRERDHRLHVDGDYKHPPEPSNYNDAIFKQSKRLAKNDPVFFQAPLRPHIGKLVLESISLQRLPVLAISVGAKHIHLLVKCPRDNPKLVIGKAKHNVTRNLRIQGLIDLPEGARLWAVGSHPKPVRNRAHQIHTHHYILDHKKEGAWVWSFTDAAPE